ncbi:MAG: hypothetical protein PHN31_00870 [Candidatus Gracilibacteria bacterium]|nr:hypothetical protein [Candidatus Gracilibacteria bacterium]
MKELIEKSNDDGSFLIIPEISEEGTNQTDTNIYAKYILDGTDGIWVQEIRVGKKFRKLGYAKKIIEILKSKNSKISGQIEEIEGGDIKYNTLEKIFSLLGFDICCGYFE